MNPRWTDSLLSDSRNVVRQLLSEEPVDVEVLRGQVRAYRTLVHREAGPLTDVEQADALFTATLALLDRTSDLPDHAQRLAQVAVRYFVLEEDGDDDLSSPYGFDDDVEVFNAVVVALGQGHHALPY